MKISDVLRFMEIEFAIRGDVEYSESIKLEELDADWPKGMPSNEEFHEASKGCAEQIAREERRANKIAEYPSAHDCLVALIEEVSIMMDRFEFAHSERFINIRSSIEEIEKRYQ